MEIGKLKDEIRESAVQEVQSALQDNLKAIQKETKAIEKETDVLISVMNKKIKELDDSKNGFFKYEGAKMYLFWVGMGSNILTLIFVIAFWALYTVK